MVNIFEDDILQRNLINEQTQVTATISCGFLVKDERHDKTSFCYPDYVGNFVISGAGKYVDVNKKTYEIKSGCIFQRFPGVKHEVYMDLSVPWVEFYIRLNRDIFTSNAKIGFLDDKNPVLYTDGFYSMYGDFFALLNSMKRLPDSELPFILLDALRILFKVNKTSRHMESSNSDFVAEACRKLKENIYAGGDDLKAIAASMNMGYESFRKKFAKSVGTSPGKYMIIERINVAKTMLEDRSTPIKSIAATLGYVDTSAFVDQFHRYVGLNPGEFAER